MEEKPNYYAIIPADVRYDNELKSIEKLLYGEITALTQKTGECWASNSYFAKLYNLYPTTISKYLNNLKQKGYISIEIQYYENSNQIEKRIICIAQTDNTYCSNEQEGIVQTDNRGIVQISKGGIAHTSKENNTSNNNTSINNTSINTIYSGSKTKPKKIKHKYGEYQNVLLTDEELEKLNQDYENTNDLITYLDEYIEMKGYKAKSHYLCIKKWVVDAVKQKQPKEELTKSQRQLKILEELGNGTIKID